MNEPRNIGTSVGEVWHIQMTPYADSTVSWKAIEVFGDRLINHPETQTLDEAITTAKNEVKAAGGKIITNWWLMNIPHKL